MSDAGPPVVQDSPGPGLSRRVRTLIVSGGLFVVLLVLALVLPVPYLVLSPGPTINTLGRYRTTGNGIAEVIAINGRTPNPTTGNLNLTTVSYSTARLTVFQALRAWLNPDEVVVPRSSIFPPGQSQQSVDRRNTQDFASSQDNATTAALCELGYPKVFGLLGVTKGGPSDGILQAGDQLVSVDGRATSTYQALTAVLQGLEPGTTVPVAIRRNGIARTVSVTLGPAPSGGKGASLGILVSSQPTCLAPFSVDLGLGNEIGGPSAGLMFALGIMDKVGSIDLTHGRFIAGTGEITPTGQVQPIGGIQLKMIAARDAGATVFLAPAANCGDVRGAIPSGLDVVKVSSLHGAVQDLQAIAAGRPVPHC